MVRGLSCLLPVLIVLTSFCHSVDPNLKFTLSLRQFEKVKDSLLNIVGRTATNPQLLNRAARLNKLQPMIREDMKFPCNVKGRRSPSPPRSVHKLMPGDIDVIAALGDSLTAGNGAAASNLLQVYTENRGISWSIGGQGTWREFLTLPNILKEFNPQLVGYALQDSLTHHRASQFNVAEAGAMSIDLPYMARQLVKRIRSDPRVDLNNDWKLITLMMGSNDICADICYTDAQAAPERHRKNLIKTLDFLKKMLPRTLVQIVTLPNLLDVLPRFKGVKPLCQITHKMECPCLIGLPNQHRQLEFLEVLRMWQRVEIEMALDPRYMDSEEFAVVTQPFTSNITFPRRVSYGKNVSDFSFLSEDCFHFSQKGYFTAVTALWNNMFQPVGRKKSNFGFEIGPLVCPSKDSPYIFTNQNS